MKKPFCILLSAILMASALGGCSSGVTTNDQTDASASPTDSQEEPTAEPTQEPEVPKYMLSSDGTNFAETVTVTYTKSESVTINVRDDSSATFNKYLLNYTSTGPAKGTITYQVNGTSHSEDFYLEEGENADFACFIDAYLDSSYAASVSSIEIIGVDKNTYDLTINSLSTITAEVLSSNTVYLQNDYLKVGVNLGYGGGLSYISYANAPSCYKNLLNEHDTGRLVQQSYYGTSSGGYKTANYGGNAWPYNPVQGGDQYGTKSKLVDYTISDDSIYVKCLPKDWAQNNMLTNSYMENTYTLVGNILRVDNRFVDFSTYTGATVRHQELPAFYTLSALKNFTYYNGKNPWTYDTLTTRTDLTFWGGNSSQYFNIASGNTETWCAWTDGNEANGDFGIGLYTPNASILLAGRNDYGNGNAYSSTANATNYVAPLRSLKIKQCKPLEYSYLITCGTLAEIRETFTNNRDMIDNTSLKKY